MHTRTRTHTKTRECSLFQIPPRKRVLSPGQSSQRPAFVGSAGPRVWEGWGLTLPSPPPQIGLSALARSVKGGNGGNSTFCKLTTTCRGRKEW